MLYLPGPRRRLRHLPRQETNQEPVEYEAIWQLIYRYFTAYYDSEKSSVAFEYSRGVQISEPYGRCKKMVPTLPFCLLIHICIYCLC